MPSRRRGCFSSISIYECYMAQKIKESGKGQEFFVVDTFQGSVNEQKHLKAVEALHSKGTSVFEAFSQNIEDCGLSKFVKPIKAESLKAVKQFEDGQCDFVFIDACHLYEAVKADILAWRPKVRKGGILAGHDYHVEQFPGVKQAVHEIFGEDFQIHGDVWLKHI